MADNKDEIQADKNDEVQNADLLPDSSSSNSSNQDDLATLVVGGLIIGGLAYGAYKLVDTIFTNREKKLSKKYESALYFFDKLRYLEAERIIEEILIESPHNRLALNLKSSILINQNKKLDEALECSQKAINYSISLEERGSFMRNLAIIYYLKEDYQNALKTDEEYIEIFSRKINKPELITYWDYYRASFSCQKTSNYKLAIRYLQQCISIDSSHNFHHFVCSSIGYCNAKINNIISAIEWYEKALKVLGTENSLDESTKNSHISVIYNWLGKLYSQKEEPENAYKMFMNSIEYDQSNPFPYAYISFYWARMDDKNKTRDYLEKSAERIDKRQPFHKELISTILNDINFQNSEDIYNSMIDILELNGLISDNMARMKKLQPINNQSISISENTALKLKEFLKKDMIDELIELLMKVTARNTKIYNEVLTQSARYSQLQREIRTELIDTQQKDIAYNRIRSGIIYIIEKLNIKNNS